MLGATLRRLNQRHFPGHCYMQPAWIVLGVNNVCNLHCKMCDVGTGVGDTNFAQNLTGTRPINMPLPLIERIIDQTKTHFPRARLAYAFTEPLIYPHLGASLEYAKRKGLYTSVTTNALNLKTQAAALISAGLDELNVSLDGPSEVHNEIRGHAHSYEKALQGLEELLKYPKRPKLAVFCAITQWNIGSLKRFADGLAHLPLSQLGFMHTVFTTASLADLHNLRWGDSYFATVSNVHHDTHLSADQLDVLWSEIRALKSAHYPFAVTCAPEMRERSQLEHFYHAPDQLYGRRCADMYATIMLKSDGTAIPAHGRCYNLAVGNIYRDSLKDIWNSQVLNKFRTDLHESGGLLPACARCCSAFH